MVPVLTLFSALESVTHVLQATGAQVHQTQYPENVNLDHNLLEVRHLAQRAPMDFTVQLVSALIQLHWLYVQRECGVRLMAIGQILITRRILVQLDSIWM